MAILGINQISILTSTSQAMHHPVARELAPAGVRSIPMHFEAQKNRCVIIQAADSETISLHATIAKPYATRIPAD